MAQALAQVRRDLGRDAVILNTRTFKKGGMFGLGGKRVVEITASIDINVLHPKEKRNLRNAIATGTAEPRIDPRLEPKRAGRLLETPPKSPVNDERLHQELNLVKQMVQELIQENRRQQHPAVPEELFETYLALINQDVSQELADEIVRQVRDQLKSEQLTDKTQVRRAVAKCIEKMVPVTGPITTGQPGRPKVIALVGPTGVGKTTTIAKLAANFKLRENRTVGLITIDTYRIAAVDQLRTYADIINVPLRVVLSPEELRQAIRSMKDCHVILIDTAGRSQSDKLKLRELKSFLNVAKPDETHLVLSSTSGQANMQTCIRQFSSIGIDRIIFTKLDEAVGIGMLLSAVRKLDQAISYITTGQSVPDDIEPGSGRQLAKMIIEHCPANAGGEQDKHKRAKNAEPMSLKRGA